MAIKHTSYTYFTFKALEERKGLCPLSAGRLKHETLKQRVDCCTDGFSAVESFIVLNIDISINILTKYREDADFALTEKTSQK